MAKITLVMCDVKPCTSQAEREYEVNGQTLYVCGEQCFARFWSREYGSWKESRYRLIVTFHELAPMQEYKPQDVTVRKNGTEAFRSDLRIVEPRYKSQIKSTE